MGNCLISNKKEEDAAATAEQNIAPPAAAPNGGVAAGEVKIEESVGPEESGRDSRAALLADSGLDFFLAVGSLVPFAGKFCDLLAALKKRIQDIEDTIDDAKEVIAWAKKQEALFEVIKEATSKSINNLVLRDGEHRGGDDEVVRLWDLDIAGEVEVETAQLDEEAKKRRDEVIAELVERGAAADLAARAFAVCSDDVHGCLDWYSAQLKRAQREVDVLYMPDFIHQVKLQVQVHEGKNVLVGFAPASFKGWKSLDETLQNSFKRPTDAAVRWAAENAWEKMTALKNIADAIDFPIKYNCRWCSSMCRAELFKDPFKDAYKAANNATSNLTEALSGSMYMDVKTLLAQTQRQTAILLQLKGDPQKTKDFRNALCCKWDGATSSHNVKNKAAADKFRAQILQPGRAGINSEGVNIELREFLGSCSQAKLRLLELTDHQKEKLDELRGGKVTLLLAPAGGGKTFVAIQRMALYLDWGGEAVLFVARNESLALFVCKWLAVMRDSEEDVLKRVHVLVAPFEDGPRRVRVETAGGQRRLVFKTRDEDTAYGLVVVDEAHHLVNNDDDEANDDDEGVLESKGDEGIAESPGALRAQLTKIGAAQKHLLFLADASQATDSVPFERKMSSLVKHLQEPVRKVALSEVVRSTKRIVAGAAAFQLEEGRIYEKKLFMSTLTLEPGMPLLPLTFRMSDGVDVSECYASNILIALNTVRCELLDTTCHSCQPGAELTDLDDCVAIVCPDKEFVDRLRKPLKRALAERFELVTAATASAVLERSAEAKPWLVLDSVDNMDGLERLIVICVDLDRDIDGGVDVPKTRSRIYRAMTRAELAVAVVNVARPRGWFKFFEHIDFDARREFWGFNAVQKTLAKKSAGDVVKEALVPAGEAVDAPNENPGRERIGSAGHEESKGGIDVVDSDAPTAPRMKRVQCIYDPRLMASPLDAEPSGYQPFEENVSRGVPFFDWAYDTQLT